MRQAIRALGFLSFLLLLSLGAQGQGYQRPKPAAGAGPPTNADLIAFDGPGRSLVVEIVNLTPYEITFKSSSITPADATEMQNKDRGTLKSFMFAPVGIPKTIPRAPQEAFQKDPNYENTITRAYPMVFSWNDRQAYVTDSWVQWTVKQVQSCWMNGNICEPYSQDVDLGLWMYRNKPPDALQSKFLAETLKDVLLATFRIIGIVVSPTSGAAWAREFVALKEIGDDYPKFEELQKLSDDGDRMFLASYVVPNPNSLCVLANQGCTPSTLSPTDTGTDAVYSIWPALYAGPCPQKINCPMMAAEAELVVSAHLLRGQKAPWCPPDPPSNGTNYVCTLGRIPTLMVTVMRHDDFGIATLASVSRFQPTNQIRLFLLQAGAGSMIPILEQRGRLGLVALRSLVEEFSPAQRQIFREMIRSMASGRPPTKEERELVHWLATALRERLK